MSTLLLTLKGNLTFNRTLFAPFIYLYDDLLIFKRRNWFVVNEITISYHHIGRVLLVRGILFNGLEIETTTADKILVKFLPKKDTVLAKKIIDQKIYHSHAKHQPTGSVTEVKEELKSYEKALNRYKELLETGKMTEVEYEKKRQGLIRTLK